MSCAGTMNQALTPDTGTVNQALATEESTAAQLPR